MLRSDLCGYRITLTETEDRDFINVRDRFLAFKNNHHLLTAF